jgi:molybdate transport system ATP-binding protein
MTRLPLNDPSRESSSTAPSLAVAIKRRLAGFTLDISFDVPEGLTVLFGPSGSGKSMTLQVLAGLIPADFASITLGETIWHESARGIFVPPQLRHIGYVPQNYALFPHLTVVQNIAFGMRKRGKVAEQHIAELISITGLDGLERRRPAQLSGGQQQRVALARALAIDPQFVLLDEPFSSLDAAVREALREELRSFYERIRVPMLLVTHDLQEAQLLADTLVILHRGIVLQAGPLQKVIRAPLTSDVAKMVGMRHCLTGTVVELRPPLSTHDQVSETIAIIQVEDIRLCASIPPELHLSAGDAVTLGVRTDEVRIESPKRINTEVDTLPTHSDGIVKRLQPRGPLCLVTVELTAGIVIDVPLIQWAARELNLAVDAPVTVHIPSCALHIFDPS